MPKDLAQNTIRVCAGAATLAGLGFGLFAAKENFDVNHQSPEMAEATRFFAEIVQQGFNALGASTVFALAGTFVGTAVAAITCCCCCNGGTLKLGSGQSDYQPVPSA